MATVTEQINALNNLIAGVNLAQSRGTYSLAEASHLHGSVTVLVDSVNSSPEEQHQQPSEVVIEEARPKKRASRKTS